MVDSIVMDLLTKLRPLLGCLYKLTDCVALLDLLLAFAHNCTVSNYGMHVSYVVTVTDLHGLHHSYSRCCTCNVIDLNVCCVRFLVCPEFTTTLAVKQGRHPILDKMSAQPPVSNNVVSYRDKQTQFSFYLCTIL